MSEIVTDAAPVVHEAEPTTEKTSPAKPKKAIKPKVKKPAKKSAKPEKKTNPNKTVSTAEVNPNNPLHKGSTRLRMFKALKKHSSGLTQSEIKAKTGMLPKSGHLAVIIGEELGRKRISKFEQEIGDKGNTVTGYAITKKGLKDLEEGKIDGNAHAGNRIGQAWTNARWNGEE